MPYGPVHPLDTPSIFWDDERIYQERYRVTQVKRLPANSEIRRVFDDSRALSVTAEGWKNESRTMRSAAGIRFFTPDFEELRKPAAQGCPSCPQKNRS
jgi:hypothetical protein